MSTRFGRWLCRHGMHKWGIETWPIGVRWCGRCSKRDPEGPTPIEIILAAPTSFREIKFKGDA